MPGSIFVVAHPSPFQVHVGATSLSALLKPAFGSSMQVLANSTIRFLHGRLHFVELRPTMHTIQEGDVNLVVDLLHLGLDLSFDLCEVAFSPS
jgi:hypothetical protein